MLYHYKEPYDSFQDVNDKELPSKLISAVGEMNYRNGETDCLMMLICKLKPIFWGMQKTIKDRLLGEDVEVTSKTSTMTNENNVFYKFLPSIEEYQNNGYECEKAFKSCKLF